MKKALVTVNIDNYEPEITRLTAVFQKAWAEKIGAELLVINSRQWPEYPCANIEKFQLAEISSRYDWTYFLDADAFVSPDAPDWAELVGDKSIVIFNGIDNRLDRFAPSTYSRRSGHRAGACTWNVICSDWSGPDLWRFPEDLDAAVSNIHPIWAEAASGHCKREHLIDDYQLSENIARFGLKVRTITDICREIGRDNVYYCHLYNCPAYQKLQAIRKRLDELGIAH